jgi:uncharacterized protein YcfJ
LRTFQQTFDRDHHWRRGRATGRLAGCAVGRVIGLGMGRVTGLAMGRVTGCARAAAPEARS